MARTRQQSAQQKEHPRTSTLRATTRAQHHTSPGRIVKIPQIKNSLRQRSALHARSEEHTTGEVEDDGYSRYRLVSVSSILTSRIRPLISQLKGLLASPAELQNRIHALVVCCTDPILVKVSLAGQVALQRTNRDMDIRRDRKGLLSLLSVCQRLRKLITPMYYGMNMFHFGPKVYYRSHPKITGGLVINF
jgi:hypothetical protein